MNEMREKRESSRRRIAAIAVVMMLAMVAVGAGLESPEVEEVDALPIAPLVIAVILFAVTAGGAYTLANMGSDSGNGDQDRTSEATLVAQSISAGLAYYDNSLANYNQIWTLTDEHWIRQAELAAASVWEQGTTYDPYEVLETSGVYLNSGYMMQNAAAQINAHYDSMTERMDLWNTMDTYKGKMSLELILGNNTTMSSTSSWAMEIGTVVRNADASASKVYIVGGDLWASAASTITSSSGTTINLSKGWNDLDSNTSFSADIYTLSEGTTYCGSILPVFGSGAASVSAGMVAEIGGETKVLTYTSAGKIYDGTSEYDKMSLQVVPNGGTAPDATDITSTLADYSELLQTVYSSMSKASSAASIVWSIYDDAGSTSAYLTTLMVPDIYEDVELSEGQKKIITVLAMQQLAEWYTDNSGDVSDFSAVMTPESMSLFVRGDVTTSAGEIYENVIFTPIFYKDTTLKNGNNTISGYGFIAIWADGEPLSGWDMESSITSADLVWVESGATLDVYEMLYDGSIVDTVSLNVSEIDPVDPTPIDPTPITPEATNKLIEYLEILFTVLGAVMIACGALMRSPIAIAIGSILILMGLFAAEPIADILDKFGISMWEYT